MKNKKVIILIMVMILPSFIINSYEINASTSSPIGEENKLNMVDDYTLAPDFNITDVDSLVDYKLSDFLGKIVMIDLFATWCGPCIAALPTIRELYLMYPEDMFQIISIDVDTSESEAQVQGFRATYNMDWIVGLDYEDPLAPEENNRTIADVLGYGSGFIPTMYLLNETGHVIYSEIGFDETTVRGILSSLLPDDVSTPYFTEINLYNTSELSIFNPKFRVFANFTEDRNLKLAELRIINDGIVKFTLQAVDLGSYFEIDQTIVLDPLFIYPFANLEIQLLVRDYFSNTNLTTVFYLPITQYIDTGPPVISNTGVEWFEVSETKYNVTVYATLEEDLLFLKKDVWFMEGATIRKAATFMDFNGTHMVASAELLYSLVMPWEIIAHLVIRDAAGNEVNADLDIAEAPEVTETPTPTPTPSPTEESSYFLFLPLLGAIALVTVVQIIRKRK